MTKDELRALLMMLTPEELTNYANSGTQEPFIDEGRMRLFTRGGEISAAAKQIYDYIDSGADPVTAAQEFLQIQPTEFPGIMLDDVQDITDTIAKSAIGSAKKKADMPTGVDQLDKLGLGSLAPLLQYTQNKPAGNYSSPSGMQDTYKSIINRNLGESDRLNNLLFEESKSTRDKDFNAKVKGGSLGNTLGGPLVGLLGMALGNRVAGEPKNEYGYTKKQFEAGRTKKLKGIDAKNARALASLEAEQRKAMARQQLYQDTYDTELAKYKVPSEFDIRKSLMLKVLND
jgi:hypothetical protein